MASKFEKLAGFEPDAKVWDRYGLSFAEWDAMSPDERAVHFNRQSVCEHKANMHEWPTDLIKSYSHDPYFQTGHMIPCARWNVSPPERWAIKCDCQMCLGHFGVTEEERPKRVNEEAVREKWRKRRKQ